MIRYEKAWRNCDDGYLEDIQLWIFYYISCIPEKRRVLRHAREKTVGERDKKQKLLLQEEPNLPIDRIKIYNKQSITSIFINRYNRNT